MRINATPSPARQAPVAQGNQTGATDSNHDNSTDTGWQHIGALADRVVGRLGVHMALENGGRERDRLRLTSRVRRLHALGERSLLEFLLELTAGDPVLETDLELQLERYSRLTPEMIDALDAREIRGPLAVVEGGRR